MVSFPYLSSFYVKRKNKSFNVSSYAMKIKDGLHEIALALSRFPSVTPSCHHSHSDHPMLFLASRDWRVHCLCLGMSSLPHNPV
jgi:hypothetical protein